MKTEELAALLNRAISVRQRLLYLKDKAASALDTCSLEEEDMELCSDIETYPELLQLRVNQLVELCTISAKTFIKPRGGVSSQEQFQAYAQSIVRELIRNIDAATYVLIRAQAQLPRILSKVHPVSLPLPLFRVRQDWEIEQPEGMPTEMPDDMPTEMPDWNEEKPKVKKGNSMEYHYLLSCGGKKMRNPIFQVIFNNEKINIQLNMPYSGRELHQALDSLLVLNDGCRKCSLRECLEYNVETCIERARDGTLMTAKKPDKAPGCTTRFTASFSKLTCAKLSTNVGYNKVN